MIVVFARPARDIDVTTFADITPIAVVCSPVWVAGGVQVEFASDLDDPTLRLCRIRAASKDAATETLMKAAIAAYVTDLAYLALPTPTAAQTTAQVQALTRQVQGLLKLAVPYDKPS